MLKHRGEVVRQSTSGDGEVEVVVRIRARVPSQADDKSRREIVRAFNENFAGRRMLGAEAMVEFRPTSEAPAVMPSAVDASGQMLAGESRAEREARKAARRAQISKEDEHGQEAS